VSLMSAQKTATKKKEEYVTIYVFGKPYKVLKGLTIQKALEYIGYRLTRGVGCRKGFCGACLTIYRKKDDFRLYAGLACQTEVEDGMQLTNIYFSPPKKPKYRIEELKPDLTEILKLFPELTRCVACNTCTKACPQELQVMDAIQAMLRGDIRTAAELTFDCIMCGACSLRCPAEIPHPWIFMLVRRLYGKYMLPKSKHLEERLKELETGKYHREIDELIKKGPEVWRKLYNERKIEKREIRR